jgi:hypothetical protein
VEYGFRDRANEIVGSISSRHDVSGVHERSEPSKMRRRVELALLIARGVTANDHLSCRPTLQQRLESRRWTGDHLRSPDRIAQSFPSGGGNRRRIGLE